MSAKERVFLRGETGRPQIVCTYVRGPGELLTLPEPQSGSVLPQVDVKSEEAVQSWSSLN